MIVTIKFGGEDRANLVLVYVDNVFQGIWNAEDVEYIFGNRG